MKRYFTSSFCIAVALSSATSAQVRRGDTSPGELVYQAPALDAGGNSNREIFLIRSDGSGQRRLTVSPGFDGAAAWSPDGRQIAFVSDRDATVEEKQRRTGQPPLDIYVMDADGSHARRVTRNGGVAPAWSPDGRRIAFVSADGVLPDDPPRVYSEKRDIFTIKLDGTDRRNVTNHPGSDNFPSWSPDGRSIAFSSRRVEGQDWTEIYVMNSDGTQPRRLTFNTPGVQECCEDAYPKWSPDGHWIAFISKRDGNSEVYKMHPDGSAQTRLTNAPGFDAFGSWSPDSHLLVFTHRSEPTGNGSLYIMAADGTDMHSVGVVGAYANWRPRH